MDLRVPHSLLRALTACAALSLSVTAPVYAGAENPTPGTLAVHGVTSVTTDPATCDTRVELGFRFELGDLPLSNGYMDPTTVTARTVNVDGAPAAGYSTRTDFSTAPYYFAVLELRGAQPGARVVSITGGAAGVTWRAFDHSNPSDEYAATLDGDYSLSFVVADCGAEPVTFSSFAAPVDGAPTLNTVRRGVTVPIRFAASRAGATITDPEAFVATVTQARCDPLAPTDPVERTAPSSRVGELFYSGDSELLVYRWSVPRGKHPCWSVTFTHESGASITAHFRTYGGR